MKPLPCSADVLAVARRVIWFEPPQRRVADPIRFLAYLMTYSTVEDIAVVRRYLDLGDFREAAGAGAARHAAGKSFTHSLVGASPSSSACADWLSAVARFISFTAHCGGHRARSLRFEAIDARHL